jgi:hypothetical protein
MRYFPPRRNFSSLSIRDLLDARDAYHVHLAHFETVVGTAVGRYLIRRGEDRDWEEGRTDQKYGPRTLANSVVRPWSWPCVLVFVRDWVEESKLPPSEVIPRTLYLSDGRAVPTCVVHAAIDEKPMPPLRELSFPSDLIGGGYSVLTDSQGSENAGSIGCMVTNGDLTFALTNRHVTGDAGRVVYSIIRGKKVPIGVSDAVQQRHLKFAEVYPGWPGERVFATIDAGLIRVDDVSQWTAQVFGVGELGDVADLNIDTISLDLIGCPVKAFGSVSGTLEGKVKALFYRYRSVGGFDYVSDVLIGPRREGAPLATRPGDSGTLWVFDPPTDQKEWEEKQFQVEKIDRGALARRYRPLALQWGGTRVLGEQKEKSAQFALATFVSSICRVLNVDVIRSWNTGHPEYWGKIAHFKIGAKACDLIPQTSPLSELMHNNLTNIGYDDDDLGKGKNFKVDREDFVPMADVPDYVFVTASKFVAARRNEPPQHFADMDVAGSSAFPGKTLLDLVKKRENISADVWQRFYEGFPPDKSPEPGAVPFRVWQLYRAMVDAIKRGDADEFIGTAGVLAHYVGDSCQPLHISILNHGRGPFRTEKEAFAKYKKSPEYKVHSIYEEGMFEREPAAMLTAIDDAIGTRAAKPIGGNGRVKTRAGYEAAVATVALMERTIATLAPKDIIDGDDPSKGPKERAEILFQSFSDQTAQCIADGCLTLASLWYTAWQEGDGDSNMSDLGPRNRDDLKNLYKSPKFVPALTFDEMIAQGFIAPGASGNRRTAKPGRTPRPTSKRPKKKTTRPRRRAARTRP